MDEFTTLRQVRQVAQFPLLTSLDGGELALLQRGGLGGPYGSISAADLVGWGLASGGTLRLSAGEAISWNGTLATPVTLRAGPLGFSLSAPVSVSGNLDAVGLSVAGQPVATHNWVQSSFDYLLAHSVASWNGRTGAVELLVEDILRAGGAPADNPVFSGRVVGPTHWNPALCDDTLVTSAWVQSALCAGLWAFAGSPYFYGSPTASTPPAGDYSQRIANTMWVTDEINTLLDSPELVGIMTAGVTTFNGRSGPVTLTATDVTGTGVLWWKNIKVDFGAVGDGVTDDSAAFLAFTSWAQTQAGTVVLVIPPGTYVLGQTFVGPTQPRGGGDFYRGIKDLVIFGYGATLTNFSRLSPYNTSPPAGGSGAGVSLATVYINVASAGSVTVTAKAAWTPGIFNVGDWVTVASLEMLGNAGAPPTWYYFEFKKIASISGNTLTFVDPLMFTHLDTYPKTLMPGSPAGQYDTGGPAAVFQMQQDWDQSVKVMGVTFTSRTGHDMGMCCRRGWMIDCAMVNPPGGPNNMLSATVCQEMTYERCRLGEFFEPDKDIGILKLINCSVAGSSSAAEFTSMSYEKLVIDGCHIPGKFLYISKNTEIVNSNIGAMTLQGPGQGIPHTCIIDNCYVGVLNSYSSTATGSLLLSNLTFSNGRFSISKSLAYNTYRIVYQLVTPGGKMFFGRQGSQAFNFGNPFIVTAIGEDATTVWFDTTLTALPTYSPGTFGAVPDNIATHPCSRMSARSIAGDRQAIQISKAAPELPLYSYIHNIYGQNLAFPVQPLVAWGKLVSMIINVIIADTGPNVTLTMRPCGANGAWRVDGTNTIGQYNPVIDLKTAGSRVITPTAVSGSVGADAIGAAPGAIWFADQVVNPYLSASVAGQTAAQMPLVEIEVITDQGVTKLSYNALAHA